MWSLILEMLYGRVLTDNHSRLAHYFNPKSYRHIWIYIVLEIQII